MPRDYFMRLIEQISQILASIISSRRGRRNDEAEAQIAAACRNHVGIPLEIVRRSAPETLLQLLEAGGALRHVRAVVLAELLMQDAAVQQDAGRSGKAVVSCAQAHALLADAVPHLPPAEQAVYRAKMHSLNVNDAEETGAI